MIFLKTKTNKRKGSTLGCLIQDGSRLLIFRFSPAPSHLIKTHTFVGFSKSCQKSNFISMHKEQKTVFISYFTYWRFFEKVQLQPLHCIHVLRRWSEKIPLDCIFILRLVFISGQIL